MASRHRYFERLLKFLRHAVYNLSIDQHRRTRPDLRKQVPIEDIDEQNPLVAQESAPEDAIEAQQRLDRIKAVLDAVSVRRREIYFAHRAGYSYAEIAAQMDISNVTISRHIARALLAIVEHSKRERGETEENGIANRTVE